MRSTAGSAHPVTTSNASTGARGRFPTLVAVDLTETGDLLHVVDELNASQTAG